MGKLKTLKKMSGNTDFPLIFVLSEGCREKLGYQPHGGSTGTVFITADPSTVLMPRALRWANRGLSWAFPLTWNHQASTAAAILHLAPSQNPGEQDTLGVDPGIA